MKTNILIACILTLLPVIFCSGNNKKDANVHPELDYASIVGVYLPVEYITVLERTKHNPRAWAFNDYTDDGLLMHDVLIVDFETVTASDRINDGESNISVWEIAHYQFEYVDNEIILIDNKNNRYRKISNDIYDVENWWEVAGNFIGSIILDRLIQSGDIILEKNIVTFPALDNRKYAINVWAISEDTINLSFGSIYDYPDDLYLEIREDEYIFYGYDYFPAGFTTGVVWSKKF